MAADVLYNKEGDPLLCSPGHVIVIQGDGEAVAGGLRVEGAFRGEMGLLEVKAFSKKDAASANTW
jgi:hypothetical protein